VALCYIKNVDNINSTKDWCFNITYLVGRAIAQAVSRLPVVAGVPGSRSPFRICSTGRGFSPSSSVSPCQYHSAVALHSDISSWGWAIVPLEASVQRHILTTPTWTTRKGLGCWISWSTFSPWICHIISLSGPLYNTIFLEGLLSPFAKMCFLFETKLAGS
jgi:hypothetical protein